MNVLSMFDGIGCCYVALERAGIKVDNYFASEIDKRAISVSQKNYRYPKIVPLWDARRVYKGVTKNYMRYFGIDLLTGGSPCQGFSLAGTRLNWDDPRSQLFFDFVEALRKFQPRYFLFENVIMPPDVRDAISDELMVEPIKINSARVSAQLRKRYYWTNIPNVTQPPDKGILLQDVILDGYVDRKKSYCIDASYTRAGDYLSYFGRRRRQLVFSCDDGLDCASLVSRARKQYKEKPFRSFDGLNKRRLEPVEIERLQTLPDGYTLVDGIRKLDRYELLGNAWTVDVIAHIFSFMEV